MSSDHEAEIRASVGAHQDLGPDYDDAVAEGLVERIGAEIDKRIDARLGQFGLVARYPGPVAVPPGPAAASPGAVAAPQAPGGPVAAPQAPGGPPGHPGYRAPSGYPPGGYPAYQGYPQPGYQVPVPGAGPSSSSIGQRNVATTVTALGSLALGVGATAIVSNGRDTGWQAVMVLLIWAAIVIVNVAYARRR